MENKNIIFKIWEIFIFILVIISIFLLVQAYFLLTPETYKVFGKFNLIISYLFLIDLIIRLVLFKGSYLKSYYFIIDLLACIDVFLPVFKIVKGFRLLRIMRVLRIARLSRLFKLFNFLSIKDNYFLKISLCNLIVFAILSILLSTFVFNQMKNTLTDEYKFFIENLLEISADEEELVSSIVNKDNILSFKIDGIFEYSFLTEEKINKIYFEDDIINVEYKGIKISFVNKNLTITKSLVELFTVLSVIPVIIIIIIISRPCKNI